MSNNFDYPKIMSEQFKFNMGPWLTEKAQRCIVALVELRKDIKKIEDNIEKPLQDYIRSDLSEALFQMTKIYSFALGSKWDVTDHDLLFDNMDDGLEELQVKYGILDKTKKQIDKEKRTAFFDKIEEYLKLDHYPGRSLLQELFELHLDFLNEKTVCGRFLTKVEQDLYRVAEGEIEWSDFVIEAKDVLDYFIKQSKEGK